MLELFSPFLRTFVNCLYRVRLTSISERLEILDCIWIQFRRTERFLLFSVGELNRVFFFKLQQTNVCLHDTVVLKWAVYNFYTWIKIHKIHTLVSLLCLA